MNPDLDLRNLSMDGLITHRMSCVNMFLIDAFLFYESVKKTFFMEFHQACIKN